MKSRTSPLSKKYRKEPQSKLNKSVICVILKDLKGYICQHLVTGYTEEIRSKSFRILHGIYDSEVSEDILQLSINAVTRGHSLKLATLPSRLEIRRNSFAARVVKPHCQRK